MTTTTPSGSLKSATLRLLRELPRDRSYAEVARECGLQTAWLTAFVRGEIEQPGVDRVQCLWEYLTGRVLDV